MQIAFWVAVVLLAHTYFLYPLGLFLWDGVRQVRESVRFLGGRERRRGGSETFLPKVTLVVPAFNEVECIAGKLNNSLSIDYPEERFEVLVGSDGSTDGTDVTVAACPDPRVRLSSAARGGKVAVLNRCIPAASGDIIVLTDANTMIDRRAIARLVRHFSDPAVGAVCGRLKLYNRTRKEYEESLYWSYESLIKYYEGKHGSVLGANGGLYAIRRSLFEALPANTIVDDFVIPGRVLQAGHKVIYDPEAVAFEETTEDYGREFARRARIAAGNFQSLRWLGSLLSPLRGFVAYAFWSHKLLRWTAPLLMAVALVANALLLRHPFYRVTLAAQLAFYALAWVGSSRPRRGRLARAASTAYYFVSMNLAMLVGFWRFLRNTQDAAWDRTARS